MTLVLTLETLGFRVKTRRGMLFHKVFHPIVSKQAGEITGEGKIRNDKLPQYAGITMEPSKG